ncbi:uncharacterized protein LOC123561539 [Mercenaria mercenaria]|uniref:uncharacterized protein LOC123561539 n=1 Tax=Mercenaria mercenaria TaxID=6596 RepID=UPI00234E8813|nr:uncharacterized protein LOC123561539 [Mercenaria mercenaria]
MNKLGALAASLTFIAFLIGVVGLIIPLWFTTEISEGTTVVHVKKKIYTGLWHTCSKTEYSVSDDYECDVIIDTNLDTHGLKAVQATTIIGLGVLFILLVILVVDLLCLDHKKWLAKVAGVIAISAGGLLLIGPIVYATDVRNDYNFDVLELNAGFGLTIVAAILALMCGIIACLM